MTNDDRDFLRTLSDAALVEGVPLTEHEAARVLDRFTADFGKVFGCACCTPGPANEERLARLRCPS